MAGRRALVCGVTGQDGAYLARLLLERGYAVHGTSRGGASANLERLGVDGGVQLHRMQPTAAAEVAAVLREVRPDEIYYLAAQSSVARSFDEPVEAWRSSAEGILHMLEGARAEAPLAKLMFAASGDCFGVTSADWPATEETRFAPRSPYAAAKCAGSHLVSVARLASRQFACSAFLFSHESPLRPETFALGKIAGAARRIAAGSDETLSLGTVDVIRDFGWAPEYVEAMWLMLQREEPLDFIVATGRSHRLSEFVELAFASVGLDWRDHVAVGSEPPRPADIAHQHADPSRAGALLGWKARVALPELAARMVAGE